MTHPEITMLRQSRAFVQRLARAAVAHGRTRYHLHRRINWHHRYDADFYQGEASLFIADVDSYVEDSCPAKPRVADLYSQRVRPRALLVTLAKIFAHWGFLLLGALAAARHRNAGLLIYRKAYVDDIEIVYDTDQPSVLRAVYPFPVSVRRQWRYLLHLRRKGYAWQLTGNRYSVSDVLRLLFKRDLRSLQRMESRAQIRSALAVVKAGFKTAQLSDEFDLGSLDFCRTLGRKGLHVVNSAHGVGKYLPVHAYREFHVLTDRQREYYMATRDCTYSRRLLNGRAPAVAGVQSSHAATDTSRINLVFLSGRSTRGIGEEFLALNESAALSRLGPAFGTSEGVRLLFRPHPNNHNPIAPPGFELLTTLDAVNGQANTVFVSYSSTCQIDPAFDGRKVLIRGHFMYPEMWFDSTEEMMSLDELENELLLLERSCRAAELTSGSRVEA